MVRVLSFESSGGDDAQAVGLAARLALQEEMSGAPA